MSKLRRNGIAAGLGGGFLAVCTGAMGQEVLSPPTVLPPAETEIAPSDPPDIPSTRPIRYSFMARAHMGTEADLDDAPGKVSVGRVGAEFGMEIPAGPQANLSLSLDYEFSYYDFTNATGFIAGSSSPFDEIHRTFLTARYSRQQTRQMVWTLGGSIGFSAEDGADLGDSLTGMVFGGMKFHFSEQFAIGAGAAVATQLEDDPFFFPTLLLDWHFAERWSLVSAGRPGLSLVYRPSDQVRLILGATYERRDFRLSDRGPLPGGVGLESQVPVSFGVEFQPTPQLQLGVAAGVALARNFELKDSRGRKVADIDADPAGFLGLQFVYRF
jgi:hypothetical protein